MRTKHLLTAMALPVLFAACTNDDLQVVSNDATKLDSRMVVEDVTLNFEDPTAESRLAYGDGYTWQANDKIGACLMDVVTDNYRGYDNVNEYTYHWSEWFDMVDHIHTNYKFTRNSAGDWTTEAKMCEGNYFFYYPYDANAGLRDAYSLGCAKQVLVNTTPEALKKAFVENNAFVGYGKVYKSDKASESVKIDMVPVFDATGIVIENTGHKTYTIEKIVLRGTAVANTAVINPTTCTPDTQYHTELTDNLNGTGYVTDVRTESWKWFNAAQYAADDIYDPAYMSNGSGWYKKTAALKDVLDYNNNGTRVNSVEVVINSGNVLTSGKSIDVIAMLRNVAVTAIANPTEAQIAADNQVVLDIHTDKGLIRDIKLAYKYTATTGSLADNRLITNVTTNHAIEAVGDGKKVKVTFDDTALDKPHEMEVKGNDELANLIHWNVDNQTDIVATLLSNVTISKSMYNELNNSIITSFTIKGNYEVSIASDVPAGALDKFIFDGVSKVKVYGTQTLAKPKTVGVENYGTLNVTGNQAYTTIYNEGTLNINTTLDKTMTITNSVNGIVNVATGKELYASVVVKNNNSHWSHTATINNAGIIRTLNNYKTVNNTGVLGKDAQAADITNNVNNYATINNSANGEAYIYTNTGNIYAKGLSTSRVNDNGNGNIIITELSKNGNFMAGTTGNIVQEIKTVVNTNAVDKRANTIWLTSTLKVEEKDAAGKYVKVNLNEDAKFGQVQIIAKSKQARIEGNGQALELKQFQVEGGATLVLSDVNVELRRQVLASGTKWGFVWMNGYKSGSTIYQAKFTVNSDATIVGLGETDTYPVLAIKPNDYTDEVYNDVDNNSASVITETTKTAAGF